MALPRKNRLIARVQICTHLNPEMASQASNTAISEGASFLFLGLRNQRDGLGIRKVQNSPQVAFCCGYQQHTSKAAWNQVQQLQHRKQFTSPFQPPALCRPFNNNSHLTLCGWAHACQTKGRRIESQNLHLHTYRVPGEESQELTAIPEIKLGRNSSKVAQNNQLHLFPLS
jgi:hypothetical protein